MIDTAVVVSLALGTIGTLSGCYATWLSRKAMRQDLSIICTDETRLQFRIVNKTLRPIPIQSSILELLFDDSNNRLVQELSLTGISIPGTLEPESSFDVKCSVDNIIAISMSSQYWMQITTQTGKTFTLSGRHEHGNNQQ